MCAHPYSRRLQVGHTCAFVPDIKARTDRDGGRIKQMRAAVLPLRVLVRHVYVAVWKQAISMLWADSIVTHDCSPQSD